MRIVCDATLAFIKRCNVLSAIIEMADFREQRACIKFCFKLGKTATECYEMLKTAFGEPKLNPVNVTISATVKVKGTNVERMCIVCTTSVRG